MRRAYVTLRSKQGLIKTVYSYFIGETEDDAVSDHEFMKRIYIEFYLSEGVKKKYKDRVVHAEKMMKTKELEIIKFKYTDPFGLAKR